jgi:hypothetical protein
MLWKQLEVGPFPAEVRRARDWARAQLPDDCPANGPGVPADTVVLLVSELVTNAVVHTGRPAVLRLLLPAPAVPGAVPSPAAVRLEVADGSGRAPSRRTARGDETSGRGLELVELLADRWGWCPEVAGKRIWCELDIPVPERRCRTRKVPARY